MILYSDNIKEMFWKSNYRYLLFLLIVEAVQNLCTYATYPNMYYIIQKHLPIVKHFAMSNEGIGSETFEFDIE